MSTVHTEIYALDILSISFPRMARLLFRFLPSAVISNFCSMRTIEHPGEEYMQVGTCPHKEDKQAKKQVCVHLLPVLVWQSTYKQGPEIHRNANVL